MEFVVESDVIVNIDDLNHNLRSSTSFSKLKIREFSRADAEPCASFTKIGKFTKCSLSPSIPEIGTQIET
ncbi:hypothetical protein G4B88_002141 [Cannabis sativa]|uniref:Uncharacterized protein n=1 Tax=Cannabis sativa TaxID=3483 RepID=A0A7J6EY82_CANSA|nr:hypothetical protein G4B88_002141 [Cannabis sativa]